MGVSGGLMAASFLLQGATTVGGGILQSQAEKNQGAYQRQQYQFNSKLATFQSDEALSRGEREANLTETRVRKVQGAQRAGLAAQGIDVNSGSAALTQDNTAVLGAEDVRTVRNNAWLEAWGYKTQANDLAFKGEFANLAAQNKSTSTLLTSGLSGLGSLAKAGAAYDNWGIGGGSPGAGESVGRSVGSNVGAWAGGGY